MPIGLIRLITMQKVIKTCSVKGMKQHYLDSNHKVVELVILNLALHMR